MTDLDLPAEVLAFRRVTSLGLTGFNALLSLVIILLDGLMGRNLTFGIVMGVVLTAIAAGSIRRAPNEPGARMMLGAVLAVTLMLLIYATRDYGPGPIQEAHMIFFVTSTFLVPLMCYRTQLVYSGATVLHHAVLTLLAPKLVWDTADTVTSVVNLGVHAFVVVTLVAPLLVLSVRMLRSAIANQRLLSDTRQMLDEATESRRLLDEAQSERLRADAALQEQMQAEAAERDRQLSFSRDLQSQLSEQLRQILNSVTATSQTIGGSARRLTDSSQEMQQGSRDMLETAETVSSRLAGVATAANQLAASVSGVSQQVAQAAENSAAAARLSNQAAATIGQLSNSGHVVNSVTDLIGEIAFRTTILAINAAVEAARAGESGRGFAVVAAEIRELANRTTEATKNVSGCIANMVDNTRQTVDIMEALAAAIGKADDSAAAIATATDAQRAATDEIAQHVAAAAAMSDNTSHKLQGVAGLTEQMVARSEEVLQFAEDLSGNVRRSEQEARRLVNSLAA